VIRFWSWKIGCKNWHALWCQHKAVYWRSLDGVIVCCWLCIALRRCHLFNQRNTACFAEACSSLTVVKAIVDIRLRLRCAIPPPRPSWPVMDSSNAYNQASAPIVCTPLHGDQSNSQFIKCLAPVFPRNCPFHFGARHPHVTHCSSGQAHSSSQTASWSVQPFLYGSQMQCCTMHCHWRRKPPKLPLPIGISSSCQKRTELGQ